MLHRTVDFDLKKWASYNQAIVKPHTHGIIAEVLSEVDLTLEDALYRGGFGRQEDFERLLRTGSDYEDASTKIIIDNKPVKAAALFAVPIYQVSKEPWCRGLDPLYWALRGHRADDGWNPINALVAYHRDAMIEFPSSDVAAFRSIEPSIDAVAAVIILDLKNKSYVEKQDEEVRKRYGKER